MDKALFEAGIATRKEVLGTDYVGRAFEENAMTDEFQKIVTEYGGCSLVSARFSAQDP